MARTAPLVFLACWTMAPMLSLADEFDRLEGRALAGVPAHPAAQRHAALTFEDLGTLPVVLDGIRSGLVVAVTDQGNPARLLLSGGFRKPRAGDADAADDPAPIPVLVVERFDTFAAGPATARLARGREVLMFDGFEYDLDTGQVVPEGQGGDIRFATDGAAGPRLEPVGDVGLYTLAASPLADAPATPGPTPGSRVVPGDFAGRYRLVADGRWSGRLDLEADAAGVLTGEFRSDQTGNVYRVTGQVQADAPNHATFAIEFPRSRQEYDARLWTEGKAALAGTANLLDRTFGFFAIRDGANAAPQDAEPSGE